jgi:hypothetical protein
MAEGVLIDLKAHSTLRAQLIRARACLVRRPTAAKRRRRSPKAWVPLTAPLKLSKTNTHFKLRKPKQSFRFITVWISRAPSSAIGTPTAPGHVGVGEIELFPPS